MSSRDRRSIAVIVDLLMAEVAEPDELCYLLLRLADNSQPQLHDVSVEAGAGGGAGRAPPLPELPLEHLHEGDKTGWAWYLTLELSAFKEPPELTRIPG